MGKGVGSDLSAVCTDFDGTAGIGLQLKGARLAKHQNEYAGRRGVGRWVLSYAMQSSETRSSETLAGDRLAGVRHIISN